MITVTSELWLWSGGSWHFVTVPEGEADEIRAHSLLNRGGFGSVKVEATISGPGSGQAVSWRTLVFPQKAGGGYLLPVKKEVRCRAGIAAGDAVTVLLELL